MKKTEVRKKTRELIRGSYDLMRERLEKVLDRNLVNFKDRDDNYRLPRIILQALLDEAKFQYKPLEKDSKKLIEQIYAQL